MGLFGFGKSAVEKGLIELYAGTLQAMHGMYGPQARKVAKEWVQMARQQAEQDGTLELDYDAYMRFANAVPEARERLAAKREDGVTDEDLQLWFGFHDLERRMIVIEDNASRIAFFLGKCEAGLSDERAAEEMRKAKPIYGDPTDTEQTKGDDRPLPVELKDRVNRWSMKQFATLDPDAIQKLVAGYSSFNALIRKEIRAGAI